MRAYLKGYLKIEFFFIYSFDSALRGPVQTLLLFADHLEAVQSRAFDNCEESAAPL
jgi:hypothetical protein